MLDIEHDVKDTNAYDYWLIIRPNTEVKVNKGNCDIHKLWQICPDFEACGDGGYHLDVTDFEQQDRCKIKRCLGENDFQYSLDRILRAHDD